MRILVYGSQEFGQVIRNLVDEVGYEFAGFVDDVHQGLDIVGNWQESRQQFAQHEIQVAIGIGYKDLAARWRVFNQVREDGFKCCTLIHPHAMVSRSASVAEGTFVMAGCVIDCSVSIGSGCVIWPGAVVNHDSIVEDNVFLSPNSTICGGCRIRQSTFIGAGAVVVDHTDITANSFVKAGMVFSNRGS